MVRWTVFCCLILAAAAMLTGCAGIRQGTAPMLRPSSEIPASNTFERVAEGKELLCTVESREQAEEVASLYGIELVDFSYSVAVFHTEEDPFEVIRRGEENDWPPLEVNRVITLDDPVGVK